MAFDRIFSVFRVSGSGLAAQRRLLDATASNIANVETTETETGRPYTPRRVQFGENGVSGLFAKEMGRAVRGLEMQRGSVRHFDKTGMPGGLPRALNDPAASGVDAEVVMEESNPTIRVYEPDHPSADADGYVEKPNINAVQEMAHMMTASRAYEANITVLNAAKAMMKKALEI